MLVTGNLVLTSREPEQSSVLSLTMTFTTSRQKSTVRVTLPGETTSTVGTVTFNLVAQGPSLKAPMSEKSQPFLEMRYRQS